MNVATHRCPSAPGPSAVAATGKCCTRVPSVRAVVDVGADRASGKRGRVGKGRGVSWRRMLSIGAFVMEHTFDVKLGRGLDGGRSCGCRGRGGRGCGGIRARSGGGRRGRRRYIYRNDICERTSVVTGMELRTAAGEDDIGVEVSLIDTKPEVTDEPRTGVIVWDGARGLGRGNALGSVALVGVRAPTP